MGPVPKFKAANATASARTVKPRAATPATPGSWSPGDRPDARPRASGRSDQAPAELGQGVHRGLGLAASDHPSGRGPRRVLPLGAVAIKELDVPDRQLKPGGLELGLHTLHPRVAPPVGVAD